MIPWFHHDGFMVPPWWYYRFTMVTEDLQRFYEIGDKHSKDFQTLFDHLRNAFTIFFMVSSCILGYSFPPHQAAT
jgi:hypothetical protein